ncbi:A-kinase anchor protein 14 isoform X2 [Camelus ferus]|uniref:A-kinase anchor protein 14 isoform X2 n=2 Tax=Camelus TaxID=9836 RepID=A0A8B8SN63_CAMFR|nr:A-kinase anchor protein 14 isoform X2 [Camelus ferus]
MVSTAPWVRAHRPPTRGQGRPRPLRPAGRRREAQAGGAHGPPRVVGLPGSGRGTRSPRADRPAAPRQGLEGPRGGSPGHVLAHRLHVLAGRQKHPRRRARLGRTCPLRCMRVQKASQSGEPRGQNLSLQRGAWLGIREAFGLRFPLVEIGVALAVLVNIPSGNPWEKLLRDCLRLSWLLLFQTRIWSLSQKKMKRTKHVRFQEEVNVAKETTSQTADTQDTSSVTEVALALAKDVIAAAVQSVKEAENPIKNIDWVTHGEFTAERGRKQIEQFVLKWEYHSRWVHYTDFLRREDMGHSIFHYIYCVRWSIPTAQIPIAQITAGVYFTIKIHKKKPPDTPIDVSYVFEGQSLVHRPGMIRFREKWLRDIIEAKCILINPNMFQFNSIGIFQNIVGLDF